jgi:hypothetical protein
VRLLSHMKHKRQRLWHSRSAQAARTPHLTQTTHRNTRARASNTHAHTHHVHHPHTLQHRVVRCFTKHRPGSHCTETDCPGISTVRHALDCIAMVVTCGCPMKATRVTPPRSTPTRAHLHLLATASCLCAPPCTLHRPVQHQQTCALEQVYLRLSPAGAVPIVSADAESPPHRARHELTRRPIGLCGVRHIVISWLRRSAARALGWLTPDPAEDGPCEEVGAGGRRWEQVGDVVARLGVRGRASGGDYRASTWW